MWLSWKASSGQDGLSKKETEAYLDQLYDEAVGAKEAWLADPTHTEENLGETYAAYSAATDRFSSEEGTAILDKQVRGSYEPRAGHY